MRGIMRKCFDFLTEIVFCLCDRYECEIEEKSCEKTV